MIDSFVQKTLVPVKNALKDADISKEEINEVILVGGSTRIPAVRSAVEKFFGKSANNSVNPDEVVALGAAVQGGVFSGDVNDVLLLDVTPLSLGIETLGGVTTFLINRNTTIPTSKSETFSTAADNQAAVDIHVLQGERKFSKDNRTLGNFQLSGIPPAPRGMPQIEVTFDIDANGILSVFAKDKATGKEQSVTIEGQSGLSDSEISDMVKNAEAAAEEDEKKFKVIEARNKLDTLVYQAEKTINENQETMPEDAKISLGEFVIAGKSALDSDDIEVLNEAFENLQTRLHETSASMYSSSTAASEDSGNEDVIDAEYEDVDT